jgi:hypothetical protein
VTVAEQLPTEGRSCQCDLRTKTLGDGCEVCNPAKTLEYVRENLGDFRRLAAHLRNCRRCGEMDVSDCSEGSEMWELAHGEKP